MTVVADTEAPAWRVIDVPTRADDLGSLGVIECVPGITFPMRRVFFLTGVPEGGIRGKHAHRSLQQLLVCVHGRLAVTLDDGVRRERVVLDDPQRAVYIPPMTWATQESLCGDAAYLVIADQPYDESDYVRDYDEFLAAARL